VADNGLRRTNRLVTVITTDDVEHYMNAHGAQQGIDRLRGERDRFTRWARQLD
jgi:hypothetical protein